MALVDSEFVLLLFWALPFILTKIKRTKKCACFWHMYDYSPPFILKKNWLFWIVEHPFLVWEFVPPFCKVISIALFTFLYYFFLWYYSFYWLLRTAKAGLEWVWSCFLYFWLLLGWQVSRFQFGFRSSHSFVLNLNNLFLFCVSWFHYNFWVNEI